MDGRTDCAPAEPARGRRGLVRRLYTNNPFYVISADLIFVGLRMSSDTHGTNFETWALMLGLAGYTLLLAVTACLLIRLGKVWDDVRSILLLVVMMFLAISVTFDDALASNPRIGIACNGIGLLFAVAVSEGLLRGIGLRLPAAFRVPYYLSLGLFFLYPVGLVPLLHAPESRATQWALFGFSSLAGVIALTLVPAVRRGASYAEENGSPWRWPLYPWTLFGLLGLAVCARSYYLCLSLHFPERSAFDASRSSNIFGLYFLVPFLFAVGLLLLEIGLVARSRAVLRTALCVPPMLLGMTLADTPSDLISARFLAIFTEATGGTPLYLTLIATMAFYALATARRVAVAPGALAASLVALSVVGPATTDLDSLVAPRAWPIVAAALLQLGLALRRRDSGRATIAAGCLVVAAVIALPESWTATDRRLVAFHLAIASVLLIGALFDDLLGRLLRDAGAIVLLLMMLAAAVDAPRRLFGIPRDVPTPYPLATIAVALAYGLWIGGRPYLVSAAVGLCAWLTALGWQGYLMLRHLVAGLDFIAWGMIFFLLAAVISVKKAGGWPSIIVWRWPGKRPDPMAQDV